MANVGHCVVITAEILVEVTNKLKELGYNDLAKKIIANHKPLKPIVKDCWNKNDTTLFDYLNDTEL
jgi:hypothetical protein